MINTREYISNLDMPEKVALFKELYSELAGYGIEGDTELAHVNTFEASLLKSLGGSGTINEITNLKEYFGGGGSAPPPPAVQSVTQQTEFPEELKPFISDILAEGQAEFGREKAEGFQPFPGAQVAGFTPEQQAAFATGRQQFTGLAGTPLGRAGTYYAPALAATALGTAEIDDADIRRRMDPFLQNVVDIAKREATRDEEAAVQARAAQAVGAGSFGGTRQGLVEAEGERNLAERLGDIEARGLSVAFQNAQQAAEQQRQRELGGGRQFAALGDVTGQRARADIAGLAGIGETQQQRNQQALDIARQEFLQEQQFPAATLQKYASLVRGFPYTMGGTTVQKSTVPTPSLAQTLTGGAATAAGLYGAFGGFKPSKEGGLVSLQGGGQPHVPVGAQKMVPMLMNMYNANPAFKNKMDRMLQQQRMPQATGVNMGLQGSKVNLGTQGGMEQGGLVSLASGTEDSTVGTTYSTHNPLDQISKFLTAGPSEEDIALKEQGTALLAAIDERPTKQERIDRAQERKMQSLYASLIAGGAGVLGADPQKGYAAAVGEGIQAGLPVAAAGMEDYYEALEEADETEVKNLIQKYSLARDATTDANKKREFGIQILTLIKSLEYDVTPEFDRADMLDYIQKHKGFEVAEGEETRDAAVIMRKTMERVREIVGNLGKEAEPGEVQKITYQVIDELLGSPVEPIEDDAIDPISAAAENIPVEDADALYGDPPKSPPLMRGGSRGEAMRQADEERIAIEERRAKQWEGRSKARRGGTS